MNFPKKILASLLQLPFGTTYVSFECGKSKYFFQ